MTLPELLDKLEAIEKKATPGPWECDDIGMYIHGPTVRSDKGRTPGEGTYPLAMVRGWGHLQYLGAKEGEEIQKAHGLLIAESRNALPVLIKCLRVAREALQLIDMRKEGFEEDLVRCPQIAWDALAELDKLAEGVK